MTEDEARRRAASALERWVQRVLANDPAAKRRILLTAGTQLPDGEFASGPPASFPLVEAVDRRSTASASVRGDDAAEQLSLAWHRPVGRGERVER